MCAIFGIGQPIFLNTAGILLKTNIPANPGRILETILERDEKIIIISFKIEFFLEIDGIAFIYSTIAGSMLVTSPSPELGETHLEKIAWLGA